MKIRIYQIDPEKDKNQVLFLGLKTLSLKNYQVDRKIYDVVFENEVNANDLEDVYTIFNINHPEGYIGRSLSKSDVVEVIEGNEETLIGFYFCDIIGFKKIDFN